MPPINIKEWWLAAATATSIIAPLAEGAPQPGDRVGVVTAARPTIRNVTGDRVVYVGSDVKFGERMATDGSGALHILFMDQSSITLGPNSAVTIDQFVFHPDKQDGQITVNLLQGVLRVVGGLVSKYSDTRVITSNGVIAIRGGITIAEANDDQSRAIFLFGQHMRMTSANGQTSQTVTRPGFGLVGKREGMSDPFRIPAEQISGLLERFESRINPAAQGEILTPKGQLVSTEDNPSGTDRPERSLALDRVDQVLDDINERDPESTRRGVFGTGANPIQS